MSSDDLREMFGIQIFHFPEYRLDLIQYVREDGLYLEIFPEPSYRVHLTTEKLRYSGMSLHRFATLLQEIDDTPDVFHVKFEKKPNGIRMILCENETGLSLVSIEFEHGSWQI